MKCTTTALTGIAALLVAATTAAVMAQPETNTKFSPERMVEVRAMMSAGPQ